MRAATAALVLVFAAGVNSCRHTDPGTAQPSAASAPEPTVSLPPPPAVVAPAPAPPHEPAAPAIVAAVSSDAARTDFDNKVRPILEARCQPCHFPGGVMYERRPFDRPETITALGTKLFTRLKDENDQQVIREFLAQHLK